MNYDKFGKAKNCDTECPGNHFEICGNTYSTTTVSISVHLTRAGVSTKRTINDFGF